VLRLNFRERSRFSSLQTYEVCRVAAWLTHLVDAVRVLMVDGSCGSRGPCEDVWHVSTFAAITRKFLRTRQKMKKLEALLMPTNKWLRSMTNSMMTEVLLCANRGIHSS